MPMPDDWRPIDDEARDDYAVAVLLMRGGSATSLVTTKMMASFVANAASAEEAKGVAVSMAIADNPSFAVHEVIAARRPPPPES